MKKSLSEEREYSVIKSNDSKGFFAKLFGNYKKEKKEMSFLDVVIKASLSVPGVKVNRTEFLTKQFKASFSESEILNMIETNPVTLEYP